MPTYEYVCRSCGEQLEKVQAFTDAPLTTCPSCEGELRKVFGNVGIVFKGSGFYKTDSRTTKTASTSNGTSTDRDAAAPAASDKSSTSTAGAESSSSSS